MPDLSRAVPPQPEQIRLAAEPAFGHQTLGDPRESAGISVLPNGCIYAIQCGQILINQVLASPVAGGIHRIYLRADGQFVEIVGPAANSEFTCGSDRLTWSGAWRELQYRCTCWLAPASSAARATWFFHVEVQNRRSTPVQCDAVLVQDLGLAARGQVRNNELFNSQYLDHHSVSHPQAGYLLMTRQNLPQVNQSHPWLLQGCLPRAVGFDTDGFDIFGIDHRSGAAPAALAKPIIGQHVRQYEAAYTAIQSEPMRLDPSKTDGVSFFGHFEADHPEPSSADDLQRLESVQAQQRQMLDALHADPIASTHPAVRSIIQSAGIAAAEEFDQADFDRLFPAPRRHKELVATRLASFFHGEDSRHVIARIKELSVARPHGHILRAGVGLTPDAPVLSCTCFAAGVFASQLTMGNTSLAKLVSVVRDPLNLVRSSGLRILVRRPESEPWQLLGTPSAFEMGLDQCRWYYKRPHASLLRITCTSGQDDPALTFDIHVDGEPLELLIVGEIAAGPAEYDHSPRLHIDPARRRITVRPDESSLLGTKQPKLAFHIVSSSADQIQQSGGDELLFEDGQRRNLPYFAIQTRSIDSFRWTIAGTLNDDGDADALCAKYERATNEPKRAPGSSFTLHPSSFPLSGSVRLSGGSDQSSASQLHDALVWFARDAVVHLATPRGLEQANGGAWGVRDVCQGSVEFLLAIDRPGVVADILRTLFSQQYLRRGDWPQWFMFPPFEQIQSPHAHGDIVIWPLKALCDYLEHSNDASLLEVELPYTDDDTFQPSAQREPLLRHVDRLLEVVGQQFLPGLSLPRFGEGDWDDSLQPADPSLRERMVSSWTCQLIYQTLRRFADAMQHFGDERRAQRANRMADDIQADFQKHLMPDGVVAGFAIFEPDSARAVQYLLHPSDSRTGIHYRLIPMTRGILSGIFTAEQARRHLDLIREHLLFPDGARLMDRPTTYDGGRERVFRRSESAAFFGREIGLQYVHAHLRYAEALAAMGCADELLHALRVANPIAVTQVVPNATARQRNCYFSSSDADFPDRYVATRDYEKLRSGSVPVNGGWRIYSSGPGIYTNLVIRHLLGLRRRFEWLEFDPVLPVALDGLRCDLVHDGKPMRYTFSIRGDGRSVKSIQINGKQLPATIQLSHPYRPGPIRIKKSDFEAALNPDRNIVTIEL